MEKVLDVERDGGSMDGTILVHGSIVRYVRPNGERHRFCLLFYQKMFRLRISAARWPRDETRSDEMTKGQNNWIADPGYARATDWPAHSEGIVSGGEVDEWRGERMDGRMDG